QKAAIEYLKRMLDDPLGFFREPFTAEPFDKLVHDQESYGNGVMDDVSRLNVNALVAVAAFRPDARKPFGRASLMTLPFAADEQVIEVIGNGPHLRFASNFGFRGGECFLGFMNRRDERSMLRQALDVVRCKTMDIE